MSGSRRGWRAREARRSLRDQMRALAWCLVVLPPVIAYARDTSLSESAAGPVIGLAMLLWFRLRPLPGSEHLGAVAHTTRLDDYDGPDALPPGPFYLAWCDCGWMGEGDHATREAAEREAREHTPHVRPGLHDTFEE